MLDSALIRRKLGALLQHLNELEPLAQITLAEYEKSPIQRHAAEKLVELVVEYATDINQAILDGLGKLPPQTYYNTFLEVANLGIIPGSLMPRLASATGLRNRLVHHYDEIDNPTVYYSLKPLLRNYRKYAKLIEGYLRREEDTRPERSKKKR